MDSKVSSDWLPRYSKATRPVLEILKKAGYFPDSPRICMYGVCMHIFMYVCMYVWRYVPIHVYVFCVYVYTRMYACFVCRIHFVNVSVCVHLSMFMHTHTHTYVHIYIHTYTHTHTRVPTYTCLIIPPVPPKARVLTYIWPTSRKDEPSSSFILTYYRLSNSKVRLVGTDAVS